MPIAGTSGKSRLERVAQQSVPLVKVRTLAEPRRWRLAKLAVVDAIVTVVPDAGVQARVGVRERVPGRPVGEQPTPSPPNPKRKLKPKHHVRDTGKVLRAFYNLLHPGGVLCIADLDTEPGTFHPADVAESVHHHGFDRNKMKMHMRELGFADTRDVTAHTIRKEVEGGQVQDFPVFLIVSRRPE